MCEPQLEGRDCDALLHEDHSYGCDLLEDLFGLNCTGCFCNETLATTAAATTSLLRTTTTTVTTTASTGLSSEATIALWTLVTAAIVVAGLLVAVFVHKLRAHMVVVPENEKRETGDDKVSRRESRRSRWKAKRTPSFVKATSEVLNRALAQQTAASAFLRYHDEIQEQESEGKATTIDRIESKRSETKTPTLGDEKPTQLSLLAASHTEQGRNAQGQVKPRVPPKTHRSETKTPPNTNRAESKTPPNTYFSNNNSDSDYSGNSGNSGSKGPTSRSGGSPHKHGRSRSVTPSLEAKIRKKKHRKSKRKPRKSNVDSPTPGSSGSSSAASTPEPSSEHGSSSKHTRSASVLQPLSEKQPVIIHEPKDGLNRVYTEAKIEAPEVRRLSSNNFRGSPSPSP